MCMCRGFLAIYVETLTSAAESVGFFIGVFEQLHGQLKVLSSQLSFSSLDIMVCFYDLFIFYSHTQA